MSGSGAIRQSNSKKSGRARRQEWMTIVVDDDDNRWSVVDHVT